MMNRRTFLAGAFASIAAQRLIGSVTNLLPGPRTWTYVNSFQHRDPSSTEVAIGFSAMRNDEVFFYSLSRFSAEDLHDSQFVAMVRKEAQNYLNTFLDPSCRCNPQFRCAMHAGMDPTETQK